MLELLKMTSIKFGKILAMSKNCGQRWGRISLQQGTTRGQLLCMTLIAWKEISIPRLGHNSLCLLLYAGLCEYAILPPSWPSLHLELIFNHLKTCPSGKFARQVWKWKSDYLLADEIKCKLSFYISLPYQSDLVWFLHDSDVQRFE